MVGRGLAALMLAVMTGVGSAQTPAPPAQPAPLFAAVISTGPAWDQSKPTAEQTYFREHSANLNRLRQAGTIVMGARYSQFGLIVVSAPTADDARKLFDADPSIAHGTFKLEVHPFAVFFNGCVGAPRQ